MESNISLLSNYDNGDWDKYWPATDNTSVYIEEYMFTNMTSDITTDQISAWNRNWPMLIPYCLIFLVGVLGNSIILYAILRHRHMRTSVNLFIANLAVADILMCFTTVTLTSVSYVTGTWVFGRVLCHLWLPMASVSEFACTFTLVAIAASRHRQVVYPLKPGAAIQTFLLITAGIWAVAVLFSSPFFIFLDLLEFSGRAACYVDWSSNRWSYSYVVTCFVIRFPVLCGSMACLYYLCFAVLKARNEYRVVVSGPSGGQGLDEHRVEVSGPTGNQDVAERRRETALNKMLMLTFAIFVVCWLPLYIIMLIINYPEFWINIEPVTAESYTTAFRVSHIVAVSTVTYKPFLYMYMNDDFRQAFKRAACISP